MRRNPIRQTMSSPSITPDSHTQGLAYFHAGQLADARRAFESAWEAAERAQNQIGMAEAANDLGVTCQKLNQREAAQQNFETAIALFATLGDDARRAQALGNLGTLLGDMKKFREAEARLEQAAAIFRTLGDRQSESLTLKWLSRTHMQHFDFFGALFAY